MPGGGRFVFAAFVCFTMTDSPCIRFDDHRTERIGLSEAVFCEGKPRRALVTLLERFAAPDAVPILFTRLAEEVLNALPLSRELRSALNYDALSRTAWFKKNPLVSDKKWPSFPPAPPTGS